MKNDAECVRGSTRIAAEVILLQVIDLLLQVILLHTFQDHFLHSRRCRRSSISILREACTEQGSLCPVSREPVAVALALDDVQNASA